ncbi:cupin domain-containing protein [Lachnospiraceae bacterium 46-15]
MQNSNFRTAFWTGCHLQMTLMCIPPCGEIGLEIHEDTDQFIRVEQGKAMVKMGKCKEQLNFQQTLCMGDAVFIPAGTWHNIVNAGMHPLKVSSIYAPPNHPWGTIHQTKADADIEEY